MAEPSTERRSRPSPQAPDLPLVSRDSQGHFTADLQCVTEHYAKTQSVPTRRKGSIRALRVMHVEGARAWAGNLDLRAENVRKVCLSFPSRTAIGLDQQAFTDTAFLLDNALDSLGEIVRQCFVKLALLTESLLQLFGSIGQEKQRPHHSFALAGAAQGTSG